MPLEEFCAINIGYKFGLWLLRGGTEVVAVKQNFTRACACTRICRLQFQEKGELKVWLRPSKGRKIAHKLGITWQLIRSPVTITKTVFGAKE